MPPLQTQFPATFLTGVSSTPYTYLQRDEFHVSDGVGSRTRTGELGSLMITDTSQISSISDSRMIWSGTPAAVSGFIGDTAFIRQAGRAARFNFAHLISGGLGRIGLGTSLTSSLAAMIGLAGTPANFARAGAGGSSPFPVVPTSIWFILRDTGYFVTSDDKLLIVENTGTTSNLKPVLWIANGQTPDFDLDSLAIVDLGGVWAVDGPVVSKTHTPTSPASSASANGNGYIEVTWTPSTSEILTMDFRRVDANNAYSLKCDQAAGKMYLYARVSGVETEIGATGGITKAFIVGTPYRVQVVFDGNSITTWVDVSRFHNYSSATFYLTATGVHVSGFSTATDLIVWRRDL